MPVQQIQPSISRSTSAKGVVHRSASIDSAIYDAGGEDSVEECNDGEEGGVEEESFDELIDNSNDSGNTRILIPRIVRYGTKRTPILLFSPKVVYGRCPEAEKIGEKYCLSFKFVKNEAKLLRSILEGHGFKEVHPSSHEFNIMWTGGGMKPFTLRSLSLFQRVNHFPRSYEMTRKDRLYKNVQKMQQEKGSKNFNFIPTTFLLPYEFEDFCGAFQREKGVWIIKPVASSQGKGIFLINHPDQVPLDENLVISRYIDNPLLIDGYKFDVRIYVAVTSYDPLVAYLYEEGLSRCDDPDIEDFGNKWSMSAMLRLLKAEGKDTFGLMMSIEDVIVKTLLSVESHISAACRMFVPHKGNCFEVYGFDILIDDELRPWVLEVNLSPSLGCDAPIDLKIKTHMICDLLNLTALPCQDPCIYSNRHKQQQQQQTQSETLKRVYFAIRRPISAGYSLSTSFTNTNSRLRATTASHHNRSHPPPHRSSNNTQNPSRSNEYFGLSSEESRILRTVKEEQKHRGGFVRIFPTSDTYEFFSTFFEQRTTSYNLMLHQRLYPERWMTSTANSNQTNSIQTSVSVGGIRRTTVPRAKHLSTAYNYSGCDLDEAIDRYKYYERRLADIIIPQPEPVPAPLPPPLPQQPQHGPSATQQQTTVLVQGINNEESTATAKSIQVTSLPRSSAPSSTAHIVRSQSSQQQHVRTESSTKRLTNVQMIKQQQQHSLVGQGEIRHSIYAKTDILNYLNEGATLTPLQARTAFSTYLQRIQFRLMLDSELKEEATTTQHMELVIRFLKRAGQNLSQPFRVEIPSRRLSLADQKRILAKELCDFLHLYNKETDAQRGTLVQLQPAANKRISSASTTASGTTTISIVSTVSSTATGVNQIDDHLFENFIRSASEADLEEMMTAYMKTNKQSAAHLGT
ncbi:unnamed protein product [Didymodactylos carnosus]|uniref:Tubulin--tyrosine ligase-like protein 5 n=1 Tax=Didymodactylos carnosus TaxID=1234261 RepID=A0A813YM12_9BILA|nr:unnamed protein product [Didymodactylos carnosus]CAF1071657.1 unnamed protein product [Didymodactylos carnosus]CAF3671541.1 unnamed protein product [Didymodactylos carnosus]CAF3835926.1 unnamed protein product [Didymodactylos carnosus]